MQKQNGSTYTWDMEYRVCEYFNRVREHFSLYMVAGQDNSCDGNSKIIVATALKIIVLSFEYSQAGITINIIRIHRRKLT